MAKEPDQTRWVGIRPTDPSEDIPTATQKRAPAIADLQAIKLNYGQHVDIDPADCTVSFPIALTAVPAGEIWVITNAMMKNTDSMCDMSISVYINGITRPVKSFYSIQKNIGVSWDGMIVMEQADRMYGMFIWVGGSG